ncbi:MAG TPA: AMP-binding protein [Actinoallomurus sp.]|jgi:acyl-CoA synthetase (AMP-forming)/AMP-acid ligase II
MNVTMLLDMAAEGFGDRTIVGHRETGLTAARLRDLSVGGAHAVRSADAVVYLAPNGSAFPVAMFAAARAGVPLVPVNYRLGEDQLSQLLANHPGAYAIAGADQADALIRAGLSPRTPEEFLAEAERDTDDDTTEADSEATAVVIYTSGTTSKPKGVLLRHHNLVSYVLGTVEFAAADMDEAALMSVPPYHIAAVSNVLTNLFAGRRFITLESFTPAEWLATVRDQGVTNAMVVPTMLARIMEAQGLDRSAGTLRSLAYGGARMPLRVIERALREWPDVDFVNAYGLTETSSTISVLGPEEHRAALESTDPAVRARLASAGKVVPAIELEIRDEDDHVLPSGVSGRVWVRGEQVSGEYAGGGSSVDARGFFDTRDWGRLDEQGYLFIEGRIDDTIIRGAENIAPAEIEDVLLRHPDVADAVVVGVPDEEWGQRIEAAVVPRQGAVLDAGALREHVRGRLRGSKTPDHIACWPELPRTQTGKIVRRDVVAGLLNERQSSAP